MAFTRLTLSGLDFQAPLSPGLTHDQRYPMNEVSLTPAQPPSSLPLNFLHQSYL